MKKQIMKSSEIRQAFLEYFVKKNHVLVESSSLIPGNDPTLLFTNAGMVQFKDTFLGIEKRSYTKAVSSQRCVRAGGKHNDLENVGYTARHHTFFEMLGNFSFGDYFKREAIQFAWEFLTIQLNIPIDRLWVTVYKDDEEAANIWLNEMGVSPDRFSRCGEKDNFWSMGDTGPCGPCTEIFYDHGADIPGGPPGSEDADGDRYVEIWNLVFMQYNRDTEGRLHPLPKPSVDTGMGLERITAVVQGVHNNYDIDTFQHLIQFLRQLAPTINPNHPSFKVISDHIRACSFLIVDGVLPSNEGRGYVLRRIIRRAVRHAHQLNLPMPFFYQLVSPLIDVMGEAYPELIENQDQIQRVLKQEENQFGKTLALGLSLLEERIKSLDGQIIPGDVAFKLYDTYGFPLDLTADIAREQGLTIEMETFERLMQHQRELSQSANQFATDYSQLSQVEESSSFHGYEKNQLDTTILGLFSEGKRVQKLVAPAKGAVLLEETPFYAESGGQVGDCGQIKGLKSQFKVNDTKQVGQAIIHYGELLTGELQINDTVHAAIDVTRRQDIRLNHTATHLLHAALKKILGSHVQQRGSLVEAERARFDFSHFEALTAKQIMDVEVLVNEQIRKNEAVHTQLMDIKQAKQEGAMALFGEKYSEVVRVLTMGDFSKELCGGTHASRTGDIGLFKIIAEYGIASGVRRIDMMTGSYALSYINQQQESLENIAHLLKTSISHIPERLSQFLHDYKQQEKELNRLQSKIALQSSQNLASEVQQIGRINLLIKELENTDNQGLRTTLDGLKSKMDNAVIVLFTKDEAKINVVAGISKTLLGQVPAAVELVKHLCGKGGGRDDMAQGGGRVPDDLDNRINQIKTMVIEHAD